MRVGREAIRARTWLALGALAACAPSADPPLGGAPVATPDGGLDAAASAPPPPLPTEAGAPTWRSRASLPAPRQEVGVVAADGRVWVIGGYDAGPRIVPTLFVYDPKADAWSTKAALPEPLHHVNAAAVGRRIYVLGALGAGFVAKGASYMYDVDADTWSPRASMPPGTERGASMVAALGDDVYVAGGLRGGAVPDVSVYTTTRDRWEALPPLPAALDHGVAAALSGRFYVIGGRGGAIGAHAPSVHVFDPATRAWSRGADLPTSRGGMAAAVVSGLVVVAGGEGDARVATGVFPEVEAFDPGQNRWFSLTAMRTPRHGTGAATVDGVVYVPGGAPRQAFDATDTVEALEP